MTKKPKAASPSQKKTPRRKADSGIEGRGRYPRHSLGKALRIPRAILEQNAGRACTQKEAAAFVGVGSGGPFNVEVSSAIKFGLLERPAAGKLQPSELAKKILRPQSSDDAIEGYRQAILNAPDFSDLYKHYRGENLPDDQFFENTAADSYNIPRASFAEFKQLFLESLELAKLTELHGDKTRITDISESQDRTDISASSDKLKRMGRTANIAATDTCFVMQPFAPPLGDYYEKIYKPAIEKAGLKPVRADADIFGAGKIMDQVWSGINTARVLVAELTTRNPNVFYELGLAHALKKPVVLISATDADVPFDLLHIRVIYYDVSDPFWGQKLLDKVAENIISAIQNPEEAIFQKPELR